MGVSSTLCLPEKKEKGQILIKNPLSKLHVWGNVDSDPALIFKWWLFAGVGLKNLLDSEEKWCPTVLILLKENANVLKEVIIKFHVQTLDTFSP